MNHPTSCIIFFILCSVDYCHGCSNSGIGPSLGSLICGIASVVVTSGSGSMALFVGMVFAAIGVIFTVISTRKIIVDISTHKNGYETFGIVIDIAPTTTTVNGNPVLEVTVEVVTEGGSVDEYIESIGTDGKKYVIGDFVRVKHHMHDINLMGKADENVISEDVRSRLIRKRGVGISVPGSFMDEEVKSSNSDPFHVDFGKDY